MTSSKYCLDTHPLIWYFTGQKTLSGKAKKILDRVFSQKIVCYLPSIIFLEALHISFKHEKFKFNDFLRHTRLENIITVPLDRLVLETGFRLGKNLEIHDRVIASTSIVTSSILVTKDSILSSVPLLKTVW